MNQLEKRKVGNDRKKKKKGEKEEIQIEIKKKISIKE